MDGAIGLHGPHHALAMVSGRGPLLGRIVEYSSDVVTVIDAAVVVGLPRPVAVVEGSNHAVNSHRLQTVATAVAQHFETWIELKMVVGIADAEE